MEKELNNISCYKEIIQSSEACNNDFGSGQFELSHCLKFKNNGEVDTHKSSEVENPNLKKGEIQKNKMLSERKEARKWVCSVKYRCKICNSQSGSIWYIKKHVQRTHGKSEDDYKKQYGGFQVNSPKLVKCEMCGDTIVRQMYCFKYHLTRCKGNVEKIRYKEYYSRYISGKKDASQKERAKEWVSSVKYRCKICKNQNKVEYSSVYISDFKKHLMKAHNSSPEEFVKQYGKAESNPPKFTTCQMCGRTIKREMNSFRNHLYVCKGNVEKLLYWQYYSRYISRNLGLQAETADEDTCKSSDLRKLELTKIKEGEVHKNECTKMLSEQEEAREWVCSVKYECKICNHQFGLVWCLKKHIQKIHGKSVEDYKKQYGTIQMNLPEWTKCEMCGNSIRREMNNFKNHLKRCKRNVEKLNFKEYYSRYIRGKKEATEKDKAKEWVCSVKYGCKICKNQKKNYMYVNELRRHLGQKHKLSEEEYVKQYGEIGSNPPKLTNCQMCGRTIKREMGCFTRHLGWCRENVECLQYWEYYSKYISQNLELQVKTIDESWMDRCQFSCRLCSITTTFKSVDKFKLHLEEAHNGKTYQEFKREFGDPCSLLKLTACSICKEPVIWEKTALSDHLSMNHSIDPQTYYSNYLYF